MVSYSIVHSVRIRQKYAPKTYGRLKTLGPAFLLTTGNLGKRTAFQVCECDCGEVTVTRVSCLRSGHTTSCKCAHRDMLRKRLTTHGQRKSREYAAWGNMKERCLNPANDKYKYYGGRGITVCERWSKFENFLADMGPNPGPKYSLERRETNANYSPDNCYWASPITQANNKRNNRLITIGNETDTLANWCRKYEMVYSVVLYRIDRARWEPLRALTTPSAKAIRNKNES